LWKNRQHPLNEEATVRLIELTKQNPNGGTIRRLALAAWPEGNVLAVVEGTPSACHSVRWLNLADGREILRKDLSGGEGVPVPALSPNLREFAYFQRDGDALHLYLERAQQKPVLRRPFAEVENMEEMQGERCFAIAFAPDGKFLQASTNGSTLGWDVTNALAGPLDQPIASTFRIAEGGADGEFLAIAPSNLSILSHTNGDCSVVNEYGNDWGGYLSSKSGGPVRGLVFSPDGRLLCVAEGRAVAVYAVPDRSEADEWADEEEFEPTRAYTLKGHKAATAVAFSPDGNTLATADVQGVIRLWEAKTGKEKVGSTAKDWKIGKIGALAFAPDGFTCVAGGEGGRLVVWDLEEADLARIAPLGSGGGGKEKPRHKDEKETSGEPAAAAPAGSAPLLSWDFENVMCSKNRSISVGIPSDPKLISGFIWQPSGRAMEGWSDTGMVLLVQRFGASDLFLWVMVNRPVRLTGVTFQHFHHHNVGPTRRGYKVQLQIACGERSASTPSTKLGEPLTVKNGNSGETGTIAVEHELWPGGGYQIRWVPKGLRGGSDTSSDIFALGNVRLDGVVIEEEQQAEAPGPKKGRRKAKPAKETVHPRPGSGVIDQELAELQARATPCPRCGKARRAWRVRKEGPNEGRLFLRCSDRGCDSFEWADSGGRRRGSS
jgi:WD40 repeat protein